MSQSSTPTLVGFSGSLRKGSYNMALLRAIAELAPPTVQLEQASIAGIPLYDGDLEAASGLPTTVRELQQKLAGSAGLIIVTPEYNSSIPGCSRTPSTGCREVTTRSALSPDVPLQLPEQAPGAWARHCRKPRGCLCSVRWA